MDKTFLHLIDTRKGNNKLRSEEFKSDFEHIAESISGVEWTELIREH